MNLTRFQELLAAYGADPARWPEAERVEAEHVLATSADALTLLAEAARLDSVLAQASTVTAPAALTARILAGAPTDSIGTTARWSWLRELWPGGAAWQPAAALAASMILGLAVGAFIPLLPQDDEAAASDAIGAFWIGDDEDWEG